MRMFLSAISTALALTGAADARAIALMPVKFFDTSKEARDQQADHNRRITLMAEALRTQLAAGNQVQPITAEAVASACNPETVPCLIELAESNTADIATFIVVHKTSTLIMQVFTQVVDLKSQSLLYNRDLSFRGDTDESWTKAAGFLARDINKALGTAP